MGDGRFNMGRSLLVTGAIMGADVRICAPEALWPDKDVQDVARERAEQSGGAHHAHRRPGGGAARCRLRAHRRLGVDGRAGRRLEDPRRRAAAVPGERRRPRAHRQPAGPVHALPARVPRHEHRGRAQGRRPDRHHRAASRSPTRCSARRPTSPSTRRRTGCTRSRRSWSPPSATEPRPRADGRTAHEDRRRPRRQRAAAPRRADDRGGPAAQRGAWPASPWPPSPRSTSWSSPTATGRRSGCWRCRRRPTTTSRSTRSTSSAPRPRA